MRESEQRETVEPGGVGDRFHIAYPGIEGNLVNVPIRPAVAARIVSDQGVILGKSKEEMLKNLKNIAKPVEVYAIQLDGAVSPGSRFLAAADLKQEIRYCKVGRVSRKFRSSFPST